jgi:hypothetical protein
MWLNNVIYENRIMEGERLELVDKDSLYFLGHDLTLRRCTLILRIPAERLHINKTTLIDCTLEAKRELKNFRWYKSFLKGCRFLGRFSGNDFGSWPDSPMEGGIEGCDFTEASLDACRFLGCDVRTLRFPPWPCFTILDPVRRHLELSAVPWPGLAGPVFGQGFSKDPPSTVAVTFSAPALAKACGTTPEAIRAIVERLDGVKY